MTDWIEITALVAGPVTAVALTLWIDQRRQQRDRRMSVMRQLLLSRGDPGDVAFTSAINLVPIEFGNADNVMTAWESFSHAAEKQENKKENVDELVKCVMIELGFSERSASQVARTPYLATGLAGQRQLLRSALEALPDIAKSSQIGSAASAQIAARVGRRTTCDGRIKRNDRDGASL